MNLLIIIFMLLFFVGVTAILFKLFFSKKFDKGGIIKNVPIRKINILLN